MVKVGCLGHNLLDALWCIHFALIGGMLVLVLVLLLFVSLTCDMNVDGGVVRKIEESYLKLERKTMRIGVA
jgi:hypothetical protein